MFGTKIFSWITLSHYVLFDHRFGYLCMRFFIPTKGVICVHFFMCMTLLVLKMLGDDLVTQHVSIIFCKALVSCDLLFVLST